jgi:hypothetical protein
VDVELSWTPLNEPLTLEGAEGKSYGGLTLRFASCTNAVITTPLGQGAKDLSITRLPWADFSARFAGRAQPSGAAIFVAPDHPDFPPEWLTRHYGVLCLGWPGVKPKTFQPGETIRCRYRIWIHRGAPDVENVTQTYREYRSDLPGRFRWNRRKLSKRRSNNGFGSHRRAPFGACALTWNRLSGRFPALLPSFASVES